MISTNRFTDNQLTEAKGKPIASYLKTQNIEPVNIIGGELQYISPFRNERTASFYVNPNKNRFYDFGGTDEMKGDAIRLVQQLKKCSFPDAVRILLDTDCSAPVSFSFSGPIYSADQEQRLRITSVHGLKNKALIRYVQNRGVLLEHAFKFLNEVHYQVEEKSYYAVGFKNDSGGFELRNALGFKGKTENGITFFDCRSASVSLFEGFFDFLSALRYYKRPQPDISSIILNTTNNLKLALPIISNFNNVNCYLDNDDAGRKVVEKLRSAGFSIKDWSKIVYPNSKDFNDFIIENHNRKV